MVSDVPCLQVKPEVVEVQDLESDLESGAVDDCCDESQVVDEIKVQDLHLTEHCSKSTELVRLFEGAFELARHENFEAFVVFGQPADVWSKLRWRESFKTENLLGICQQTRSRSVSVCEEECVDGRW